MKKKERIDKHLYNNNIHKKNHLDKTSIILTSGLGIILVFVIIFISGIIPFNKLFSNENDPHFKTTRATVFSFESKEMYTQTKIGNTNMTVAYNIKYRYKINGVIYENEEQISSTAVPNFRQYVSQHLNQEVFFACYEIANPRNSSLVENIK